MTLLRALLIPFHFTSLVFIATLALLLAVAIHFDPSGFLWLLPAFIIASLVFKYAFVMLESIADGEPQAPVASIEMLSPFEQRPLALLLVIIAIGQITWWTHSDIAHACTALLFALVPAFIGVLATTRKLMLALHPLVIIQTIWGMGIWYPVVLLVVAVTAAMVVWAASSGLWLMIVCWQTGMSLLLVFSLIGGVMYQRRFEIGHEPRISPERDVAHRNREHDRMLSRALDEMYGAIRLGDLVRAMNELEHWLSGADEEFIAADCQRIHATIRGWNDAGMLTAAGRRVAEALLQTGHPHMLHDLMAATLQMQPEFTIKTEAGLLAAVQALQAVGDRGLAQQLVRNFVKTFPAQVTPGIVALHQRLERTSQ